MKSLPILIFEGVLAAAIVFAGVSNRKVLFINGERSAVIILGIAGMLLCTMSVGRFISSAPAHPLAILGYLFGTAALLSLMTQIFRWNLPFIGNPRTALYILAVCMLAKGIIARFDSIIIK